MTPLLEWKEPRAVVDYELRKNIAMIFGGFFEPKSDWAGVPILRSRWTVWGVLGNSLHLFGGVWTIYFVVALAFSFAKAELPLNIILLMILGISVSLCSFFLRELVKGLVKRVRKHQILPRGVQLANGGFLPWYKIESIIISPHHANSLLYFESPDDFFNTSFHQILFVLKETTPRKPKWYLPDTSGEAVDSSQILYFDSREIVPAELRAICVENVGAERVFIMKNPATAL